MRARDARPTSACAVLLTSTVPSLIAIAFLGSLLDGSGFLSRVTALQHGLG